MKLATIGLVIFACLIGLTTIVVYELDAKPNFQIGQSNEQSELQVKTRNQSRADAIGCLSSAIDSNIRHMVLPPSGSLPDWLVCCQTTKGPLSVAVRQNWAPIGAKRFLQLVDDGHFDVGVPLFRCLRNFICQFGLSSQPERNRRRYRAIPDDSPWLPQGPSNRERDGRVRFPKGYLAYAGAGHNSRSIQLIIALQDSRQLAGGSPWEVPWGELLGNASFATLDQIYTGYGEKGPSQGVLNNKGWTNDLKLKFPLLDHILSCFRVEQISKKDSRQ
mmetsp:Transcript_8843/g.13553  ORF Transcript_8843/g.13553 Transcript_8843/m.13553 type:complete len:275 (-) Transcript_8843:66-890(-)